MSKDLSGLSYINVTGNNPLELFKKWQDEIINAGHGLLFTHLMNLATSTRDGNVSNRNVIMKDYDESGFVFITTNQGRKYEQISENPRAASTFTWCYKSNEKHIAKQVRIEGGVYSLSSEKCRYYYDREAFFAQIRAHICKQGKEVDWFVLKDRHDELVDDVINNRKTLPMPENYVGFYIVPERMDFYYAWDHYIADRVVFTKSNNEWSVKRVCT